MNVRSYKHIPFFMCNFNLNFLFDKEKLKLDVWKDRLNWLYFEVRVVNVKDHEPLKETIPSTKLLHLILNVIMEKYHMIRYRQWNWNDTWNFHATFMQKCYIKSS